MSQKKKSKKSNSKSGANRFGSPAKRAEYLEKKLANKIANGRLTTAQFQSELEKLAEQPQTVDTSKTFLELLKVAYDKDLRLWMAGLENRKSVRSSYQALIVGYEDKQVEDETIDDEHTGNTEGIDNSSECRLGINGMAIIYLTSLKRLKSLRHVFADVSEDDHELCAYEVGWKTEFDKLINGNKAAMDSDEEYVDSIIFNLSSEHEYQFTLKEVAIAMGVETTDVIEGQLTLTD